MIPGFCYSNLGRKTGGLELASTSSPVFQVNRLTKCASHRQIVIDSPTIGRGGVFVYILHILHLLLTFLFSGLSFCFCLRSICHGFPDDVISFSDLSDEGCANYWFIGLRAMSILVCCFGKIVGVNFCCYIV